MTEVEWKLALTPAEYRRLLNAVGPGEPRHTLNRYWETPDHALRRQGCGLRLRQTSGKPSVLTFKYALRKSKSRTAGLHRRGEVECRISDLTARRLRQGKLSPIDLRNAVARRARAVLGRPSLSPLGDLRLERRKIRWDGLVLELDRFAVGSSTYHEVEVEHGDPDGVAKRLRSLFRELRIHWKPKSQTKVSYLYEQHDDARTSRRHTSSRSR